MVSSNVPQKSSRFRPLTLGRFKADIDPTPEPYAVRASLNRAAIACGLLSLACLPLSAAYDLYYHIGPEWRGYLPHVSPSASHLATGFLYASGLMAGWTLFLLALTRTNVRGVYLRLKSLSDRLTPVAWGTAV